MIGLWAEDEIDERRAAADLVALGLGNAAGHGDQHGFAPARFVCFHRTDLAELGKDLFRRLFADMASVEDDQIGILGRGRPIKADLRQQLGHARRIVDVHLTTMGCYDDTLSHTLTLAVAIAVPVGSTRLAPARPGSAPARLRWRWAARALAEAARRARQPCHRQHAHGNNGRATCATRNRR